MDRHRAAVAVLALSLLAAACMREPAPAPGAQPGGGVSSGSVAGGGAVPSGTIVAFAGPQLPAGWTLCDGRATPGGQTTPDLRGRFVMGADTAAADAGQMGGAPQHTHQAEAGPGRGARGADADNDFSTATSGHSHAITLQPGESLPPFVKLIYIMKD